VLCSTPYKRGVQEFGCGQCGPCRINRRRIWSTRIQVEAASHVWSSFVTLTYEDAFLPPNGSLLRYHYRAFTKGIRYRYFGVGEYGDLGGRPHYHLVLFGANPFDAELREYVESRWKHGFVHIGNFSPSVANYVAGYTVKKMGKRDDPRLMGRAPEFATMSRRPAIGTCIVPFLAQRTLADQRQAVERGDVVSTIRLNGKEVPLGQTLTEKVRKAVNLPDSFSDRRGRLAIDWAQRMHSNPDLISYREACRATQADRARGLSKRSKGRL